MLDQYHLEQHHWVYARSAIVFAVQWLHHLVQPAKIHCSVYFPQQMLLWHQAVYYKVDELQANQLRSIVKSRSPLACLDA